MTVMKKAVVLACVAGLAMGLAAAGIGAEEQEGTQSAATVWEYAGRLLDRDGAPLAGRWTIEARLYGQAEGGDVLWSRQAPVWADVDGRYSVQLLDALEPPDGAPDSKLDDVLLAGPVWIQCTVGEDDEALVPRAAVAAAPYALTADAACGASENFDVGGSLDVAGSTHAEELDAGGDVSVRGDLSVANELSVAGDVSLDVDLSAESFSGCGAVPVGTIILWHGADTEIPDGWAVCDGQDGRPDLRGRFPVGAGGDKYSVGATGGAARVQLEIAQIPNHNHGIEVYNSGNMRSVSTGASQNDQVWHGLGSTHSGSACGNSDGDADGDADEHENRPPFMALHYIIRVD
jgi:microcystin-dependent protein